MQMTDRRALENCTELSGWMVADLFDAEWRTDKVPPRQTLTVIIGLSAALWAPVIAAAVWLVQ